MRTDIDYRKLENLWNGFDQYYQFTTLTEDSTADLVCENWVAIDRGFVPVTKTALAFWFGAVGSPTSTIFASMFGNFSSNDFNDIMNFFDTNKHRISFASDAKYRKIHFQQFIKSVCESLGKGSLHDFVFDKLGSQPYSNYDILHDRCINNWWQWGRMAQWCFAEALNTYTIVPILSRTMEFGEQGKSHTAGWLLANKKRWLESNYSELDTKAISDFEIWAKEYIRNSTPIKNLNFYTLETACCNYKRQHKGSRYAGCYIDELYDDLQTLKHDWPEYEYLYKSFMNSRQKVLPNNLLYENSNDFDPNKPAYQKSWHDAFMLHGRMPRVEAWANNKKQRWCDLVDLGYEPNLGDMWE